MPPESDGALAKPRLRRPGWTLAPLLAFLALWMLAFTISTAGHGGPSGTRLAGDFAILMSGVHVLENGGNPYDRAPLYAAETRLLRSEHLAVPKQQDFIRVGNPPLLFWTLRPLARLSFTAAAWLWLSFMALLLIVGLLLLFATLGWNRRALALSLCVCVPQVCLSVYYGNVDAVVFFAAALAVALARRYPLLAGVALTVTVLKPQLAAGIIVMFLLFWTPRPLRSAIGLLVGLTAGFALTLLTCGAGNLGAWVHALFGYSRELAIQPDIASFSGMYVYSASSGVRVALELGSVLVAAGLTFLWWQRLPKYRPLPISASAWLWFVWFLATPFAHFHDEVILVMPALAVLGMNGRRFTERAPMAMLYALVFGLFLFPTSRFHTDLQGLALVPAAVCALIVGRRDSMSIGPSPAIRPSTSTEVAIAG